MVTDSVEIYLFSAYYDDRPGLESPPVVRLVAVSEVLDNRTMLCLLWFEGKESPEKVSMQIDKLGLGVYRHGKLFREYIYTCPLLRDDAPSHVSIVSNEWRWPSTLMRVQLPVKPAENEKLDIGSCVSVSYWYQDPYKIIEWLELHKMWGVKEVTIYNNSLAAESIRVFQHYQKEGFVDFRNAPDVMPDAGESTKWLNMAPVINDCMYRNLYRYKKILVTDLDEFITPRINQNYQQMINAINMVQPRKHPYKSYMFRNAYFFSDFGPTYSEPAYSTVLRYANRVKPSKYGYSVKSITDSQVCITLQNHYCWKRVKKYDKDSWTLEAPLDIAMNQHYKKCHFDSYLRKPGTCKNMMTEKYVDNKMLRFKDELSKRIEATLGKLRLPLKPEVTQTTQTTLK